MSTTEKINARIFFTSVYVAQPTDDRLQQANKKKIKKENQENLREFRMSHLLMNTEKELQD